MGCNANSSCTHSAVVGTVCAAIAGIGCVGSPKNISGRIRCVCVHRSSGIVKPIVCQNIIKSATDPVIANIPIHRAAIIRLADFNSASGTAVCGFFHGGNLVIRICEVEGVSSLHIRHGNQFILQPFTAGFHRILRNCAAIILDRDQFAVLIIKCVLITGIIGNGVHIVGNCRAAGCMTLIRKSGNCDLGSAGIFLCNFFNSILCTCGIIIGCSCTIFRVVNQDFVSIIIFYPQ